MKVLVVGSTGYVGMMLLRILSSHPEIDAIVPVSRSAAGKRLREIDPALGPAIEPLLAGTDGRLVSLEGASPESADVIFSALPHGAAAALVGPFVGTTPVIDLSADFRITSLERYEAVYATKHPYPELLDRAVYGLTEWHREEIATAAIVACPGCYPTATLLPLLPFTDIVRTPAIVNALSGISGAGRKEKQDLLFNERSENANAYNPGRAHRHVPEIEQELASLEILFTPHLVPLKQGMIVTTVAELSRDISQDEAEQRIRDAYEGSSFVGLSPRGIPQSRDVRNTNRCDIGVRVHGTHIELFSAIDNLYKGAAGQGVQNMNVRLGLPEHLGLRAHGEF
ncbi:MAG TPA: N-acetyl-gamma-glutamyl-phosphate reductase [Spirochaetia bacterium]|nr:N-acetyl-gamma-glutamyl-phosphate reductase [Spirochaetia bacterium]